MSCLLTTYTREDFVDAGKRFGVGFPLQPHNYLLISSFSTFGKRQPATPVRELSLIRAASVPPNHNLPIGQSTIWHMSNNVGRVGTLDSRTSQRNFSHLSCTAVAKLVTRQQLTCLIILGVNSIRSTARYVHIYTCSTYKSHFLMNPPTFDSRCSIYSIRFKCPIITQLLTVESKYIYRFSD